jgi:uncharacterized protein with HEPN domain
MRREELYLMDIVEAADAIQRFLTGVDRETFLLLTCTIGLRISGVGRGCLSPPDCTDHAAGVGTPALQPVPSAGPDGNIRKITPDDELLWSAVLQKLIRHPADEAAARLPREFRERHPEVEWADIIGFHNIAVHAYFSVARPIVWVAATQEAPALRRMVADILASEYPEVELPKAPEGPGRAGN